APAAAAEPSVAAAASAAPGPRAALVPPARAQPGEAAAVSVASPAALVDINTASVDELNGLGGRFGKAIIRGRPYRSIEDLVSKRILTRAVFNRIKDRIAAR
ncbi:MAG: helix-hairpin-helix domain-containing protein, partial [Pseudomonadota bacterium]|nr:helix-hairpin-helix domain-containing protein [Pseudomonadota bacterium]